MDKSLNSSWIAYFVKFMSICSPHCKILSKPMVCGIQARLNGMLPNYFCFSCHIYPSNLAFFCQTSSAMNTVTKFNKIILVPSKMVEHVNIKRN